MRIVTITLLSCATIFLVSSISVYADHPEILWYYDLDAPSFGSSATADLDRDGKLEIVFGTYFGDEHIYCINADSGNTLWTFNTGGCNDASPVIADVDLDDELEVIVPASSPCMVYCFDGATGDIEWSTPTGSNSIDSPPAIADVDNDDKPEVIFGTFYGYVYCLNGEDGSQVWRTNLGTDSFIQTGPNILDVDGNGQLDVVVAQYAGDTRVYALTGDSAEVIWFNDQPTDWMYHGGSFADIDEDTKPEIVIGSYDGNVYLINAEDGSPEWDYPAPYYIGAPTSVADLDNDDHYEIVFVSYNRLTVLSHTGSHQWTCTTGGNMFRGAAISDVDGNGVLDVAFGSDDGILRVRHGDDGSELWSYDLGAHYGNTFEMDHAPVIADFNGDGKLDIFIVGGYGTSSNPQDNHGRAYALTAGEGMGAGWPMFRHDIVHTGCFETIDYMCGDADGNGSLDINDITYLAGYLYNSGPPPSPLFLGDVDSIAGINSNDIQAILYEGFFGYELYCPPFPDSVLEVTDDTLEIRNTTVFPGNDTWAVELWLRSISQVETVSFPFSFECTTSDLTCDSISFVGSVYSHYTPDFQISVIDSSASEALLVLLHSSLDAVPDPGEGLLATAHFSLDGSSESQEIVIDTTDMAPSNIVIFNKYGPPMRAFIPTIYRKPSYLCGDVDSSFTVDIDDVVHLINFIFAGGPAPDPYEAGDADCSSVVDIDDVVYLITYIFSGGTPPCDTNDDGIPDC